MFKKVSWQDPVTVAESLAQDQNYEENWIFLHSGLHAEIANSKSYLALYPKNEIISANFKELDLALKNSDQTWFGYLGYDLKNSLENLTKDQDFKIKLPNLWFASFNLVLEFDHNQKTLNCFYENESYLDFFNSRRASAAPLRGDPRAANCRASSTQSFKIGSLKSNFSKTEYLEKVQNIKNRIAEGDFYQANLTRKFYGKIEAKNKFDIFTKLNEISPGNYSAFLKLGENYIISSSPELFLQIQKNGQVKSSPIKGTAPRFEEQEQDLRSKEFLQNCEKEQAENLMIVDLVRNDLGRTCQLNSVEVKNLFKVNSYKTLHHMSSDILGLKDKKFSNLDVIKNCFPPASMTGTPKIKAMQVCSELEKVKRGVYSGAIGFISNNECGLSVVIRTLIIQGKNFEFQVGGAITYESEPIKEWQETMNKALGISKTLGINIETLKDL